MLTPGQWIRVYERMRRECDCVFVFEELSKLFGTRFSVRIFMNEVYLLTLLLLANESASI